MGISCKLSLKPIHWWLPIAKSHACMSSNGWFRDTSWSIFGVSSMGRPVISARSSPAAQSRIAWSPWFSRNHHGWGTPAASDPPGTAGYAEDGNPSVKEWWMYECNGWGYTQQYGNLGIVGKILGCAEDGGYFGIKEWLMQWMLTTIYNVTLWNVNGSRMGYDIWYYELQWLYWWFNHQKPGDLSNKQFVFLRLGYDGDTLWNILWMT